MKKVNIHDLNFKKAIMNALKYVLSKDDISEEDITQENIGKESFLNFNNN